MGKELPDIDVVLPVQSELWNVLRDLIIQPNRSILIELHNRGCGRNDLSE